MSFPAQYALESPKKKGSRDAERTRALLLKIAAEHIAAVGFHKMTISAVAAEAKVSQSGLLHHFPSKADLLTAVLEDRDRGEGEFLRADGDVPLGWEAFESLVSLAARNTTQKCWVRLYARIASEAADPEHPGHEWITRHYRGMRAWLLDAVAHGVEQGTIKPEIPAAIVVDSSIALLDGIQQQWVIDPDSVAMVASVRLHVQMLRGAWELSS